MSRGALSGIKVLDLSQLVAGPYASRLLAGLGAEVIKVEPPEGDVSRIMGPFVSGTPDIEQSALFLFLNQGKHGLTLDLSCNEGRLQLRHLLSDADVLVESFSGRLSSDLGLSSADLSAINPRLIVASITPFGRSGPYSDFQEAELVSHALGGLLYLTGRPDRSPLAPPGWQASYLAGSAAANAILLALHYRSRNGVGQQVDIAHIEVLASVLEGAVAEVSAGMPSPRRQGNHRDSRSLVALLPCSDGHVVLAIPTDLDWESLVCLVGDDRLRSREFATSMSRRRNRAALVSILVEWLAGIDRATFFESAQRWRLPCCTVLSPAELCADPQHLARAFFCDIDHPTAGSRQYPGPPFRHSLTPWQSRRAPLLGEHNAAYLSRTTQTTTPSALRTPDSQGDLPTLSHSNGPLTGIRVLDLTSMWAGPLCTRSLADAGAEVVKIELATRPDGTRSRPFGQASDNHVAPFFAELNRNKRGITLDLHLPDGRRHFLELVRSADVVVENFSPRVMPNLGLDYPVLRQVKPDLIMLSMPAFGATGPYRDAVAYGSGIEAMSGISALTGYVPGEPALLGVPFGDPVAAFHGVTALLAALHHRRQTGEGQNVELAQREALTQFIGEYIILSDEATSPQQYGNRHALMVPHGCYPCRGKDRWVVLAVADDQQFHRLLRAMRRPDLLDDRRFADLASRREHESVLDALISDWTAKRTAYRAMRSLHKAGVSAGAVLQPRQILHDPHFVARQVFGPAGLSSNGSFRLPRPPYELSACPFILRKPAPRLGEHNGDVLH